MSRKPKSRKPAKVEIYLPKGKKDIFNKWKGKMSLSGVFWSAFEEEVRHIKLSQKVTVKSLYDELGQVPNDYQVIIETEEGGLVYKFEVVVDHDQKTAALREIVGEE